VSCLVNGALCCTEVGFPLKESQLEDIYAYQLAEVVQCIARLMVGLGQNRGDIVLVSVAKSGKVIFTMGDG
jgi:hypothetical protein